MKTEKDDQLWQQAKGRAEFKIHLITFVVIMSMLWMLWIFTGSIHRHPWPIYPTIGWGIGVVMNYLGVYKFSNAAEKEYEKLKKQEPNAAM
jgi:hypothetical protein